jgi:hypothetical protein
VLQIEAGGIMSCMRRTAWSTSALGWAAPIALAALLVAQHSQAQQPPSLAAFLLPPLPTFQLSLPVLLLPSSQSRWLPQEGSSATAYWQSALVPRAWREARDDELRLELETGRWEVGRLSLTSAISTVPGRERDCEPGCRGAGWSSTLRWKYNAGDLGPLRQAGPELSVGYTPARPGRKSQGLLRGGFSGKF